MYKFNKILIALDTRYSNKELIDAACKICQLSNAAEVYIINVIKEIHIPTEIKKEFPDIIEKALEERRESIQKEIDEFFVCQGVKPNLFIKQGQVTKEILKFSSENKIDLILTGRGKPGKAGGVQIQRLARRAGCSMLVIPEGKTLDWKKILVPIDFSNYSKMALEKAVTFAGKIEPSPEVIAQNVFQIPTGYHYTGKTFEEFGEIMKKNAKKDYENFISDLKLKKVKLKDIYTLDKDDDVISAIYKKAKDVKADIIIIGAKGRTATTAIFIGSKAEKMVQLDSDIPLLIIRPKGKRAGFREYLQEL